MLKIAVYAGSFDPITFGHQNIIAKAADAFDILYVVVFDNPAKKHLFSLSERKSLISVESNIQVTSSTGSLAQFCRVYDVNYLVRGLRNVTDYEYEIQMAAINQDLMPTVDTVFFIPDTEYLHISSSMVKQLAMLGEDVSKYVGSNVKEALYKKFTKINT